MSQTVVEPSLPSKVSLPVRRGLACLAVAGVTWGTTGAAVDIVWVRFS